MQNARGLGNKQTESTSDFGLEKSRRYHEMACEAIAGGVNSNVRLAGQPLCFASARGSRLVDLDGNEYIDYALGMGPTILGHAPAEVLADVSRSLENGQLFAGQHHSELELARLLKQCIPSAELVRIGMTGSEMVQAALRVARAHTGRSGFIKFEGQYHGWFDNVLLNQSGPPGDRTQGLPLPARAETRGHAASAAQDTFVLPWNDADAVADVLKSHGDRVAAIITEPVMFNCGAIEPRPGYLQSLRTLCDAHGVVLIFDEVITGFRLGLGGAQERFGIRPDLSIFAKALGGGFPVAAITGRREIMSLFASGVNHSGTYNSNAISLAAAIATLKVLRRDDGAVFDRIERIGGMLMSGIREIAQRRSLDLKVTGFDAAFHTQFTSEREVYDYASYMRGDAVRLKRFLRALLLRGIRPTSRGTWFVSAAHDESDVDRTLSAVDAVLANNLGEVP